MAKYDIPQYPTKRLRYFNNQFLKEKDFIDDQAAHYAHERAQLRALCAPGVLEGLLVTPGEAGGPLQISAGVAVDRSGRLIVLDPAGTGPSPSGLSAGSYLLYIQFNEVATDLASESDNTRWTSQPVLGAAANLAGVPAGAVVLGSFTVTGSQITAQSAAGRQYAGVRLPGPGSQGDTPVAATLASNGSTVDGAVLAGTLAVRRDVAAGLGPTLTLINGAAAAANSAAALEFHVYDPGASDPAARIQAVGDGNSSAALVVSTKAPGGVANPLTERFRITSAGDAQFKGGISVATGQHVTLSGNTDLAVGGGLTASGGITVPTGQHVTLSGNTDLTVGGAASVGGALTATGAIAASGGITVPTGQHVTLSGNTDLTVGGAASVGGALTATGAITANGGIAVPTGQHVTLNGNADLTVGGAASVGGALTATGAITANGGITVPTGQHVTLNGNADLTVNGALNASGGLTVATGKKVTLSGNADLTVGGPTILQGTLKVGTTNAVQINRFTSEPIGGLSDPDRQVTVPTGSAVKAYVDGVAGAQSGRLLGIQVLTGNGTATPTPGTKRVRLRMIGGGGGGGGAAVATTAATTVAAGAGGSSGALLEVTIASQDALSYGSFACGAGGTGGSVSGSGATSTAANGSSGADTTISINGATYTARGGAGGAAMVNSVQTAVLVALASAPAAGPAIPGGALALRSGVYGPGSNGYIFSGVKIGGAGGSSEFGAGGPKGASGTGAGGGGGGGEAVVGTNQAGGNGAAGCIVLEEYS